MGQTNLGDNKYMHKLYSQAEGKPHMCCIFPLYSYLIDLVIVDNEVVLDLFATFTPQNGPSNGTMIAV